MGFVGKNGTVIDAIEPGLGVVVETNADTDDFKVAGQRYRIRLAQVDEGEEKWIDLNEDELMFVVESVSKERPDFARGVSRIYFRQQKARRKASL